jgi:hypothetical protein
MSQKIEPTKSSSLIKKKITFGLKRSATNDEEVDLNNKFRRKHSSRYDITPSEAQDVYNEKVSKEYVYPEFLYQGQETTDNTKSNRRQITRQELEELLGRGYKIRRQKQRDNGDIEFDICDAVSCSFFLLIAGVGIAHASGFFAGKRKRKITKKKRTQKRRKYTKRR